MEWLTTSLLAGDKFMPEMHLRQLGFTYSPCGPFAKNKEIIQKYKETKNSRYIYKIELDIACFQHDMTYGYFKDLTRKTAPDEILRDKAFKIPQNLKYDGFQRNLLQWFINSLIKICFSGTVRDLSYVNYER